MGLSDALSWSIQAYEHNQQGKTPPKGINKFGYNLSVGATEETIFGVGGSRTWETTGFSAQLVSSNNGDTQTYEIQGLDANGDWQTVNVTATGTTNAAISGTWLDIFRIKNLDALTDQNAGSVDTFKVGDSGNPKCRVLTGANQSTCGAMTIPRNYVGYLRKVKTTSQSELMQGRLYVNNRLQWQSINEPEKYDLMPAYPPLARVELRAVLTGGGSAVPVEGNFDLVLAAK